jgi:diguanylate cyclase (GGDEF)-like protein
MSNLSLRSILTLGAITLAIAITASFAGMTERLATSQLKLQVGSSLAHRTVQLGEKIDRFINEREENIISTASVLTDLDVLQSPSRVRTRLNAIQKTHEGFSWIGYADANGKVLAASGGILEGGDVSQRPWFRSGLKSTYVGDVHGAMMLEKLLNSSAAEPLRFLDIAMPLIDKNNIFSGVLGAHVNVQSIQQLTLSMPSQERSEFILLGEKDVVLIGPKDLQDKVLSLSSVKAARAGKVGYTIDRWPDGKNYLTGYSPSGGYKNYSGLGWIVLEREEVGTAFAPVQQLREQFIIWGIIFACMFALCGWIAASRVSRPLLDLTRSAEALSGETLRREIPFVKSYREVVVLADALRNMISEIAHREALLEHHSTYHNITNLPNRLLTMAMLTQLASHLEKGGQITLLSIDLDRFKSVNDKLGFTAGNTVLRKAARRLQECIGTEAFLGHLSEDEFVVVVNSSLPSPSLTLSLATRAQERLAQPFTIEGIDFFLSASVGISRFPHDTDEVSDLLNYSEIARHQAKTVGHGHIQFYDAKVNKQAAERLDLERDLRLALAHDELELYYQPQVCLQNGSIKGFEALIRWNHPRRGLISPAIFIPLAEDTGLILAIGDWVLNEACRQAQGWREIGLPAMKIAVNVSVHQFNGGDLVQKVLGALTRSGLDPKSLKLEITESLLMKNVESSIATMTALTAIGVRLAIDDFGTGYSSLSYLKRFPISELKIDQAFVKDLSEETQDAAIVNTIISLAHNLGLNVVAEGVETIAQASFLRKAGCGEMQGYYFSRPIRAEAVSNFCRMHNEAAQRALEQVIAGASSDAAEVQPG